MTSFFEAPERLNKVDQDTRSALGTNDIHITEYRSPRGFDLVVFLLCLLTFVSFTLRLFIQPDSPFFVKYIQDNTLTRIIFKIHGRIFWPMLTIHSVEAFWFERSMLLKHGVARASLLWWKWTVNSFIEGVGVYKRFNKLV